LKIDQFAGMRHAFLYGPIISYREPSQFFDRINDIGKPLELTVRGSMSGTKKRSQKHVQLSRSRSSPGDRCQPQEGPSVPKKRSRQSICIDWLAMWPALVAIGLRAIQTESFKDYTTLIAIPGHV